MSSSILDRKIDYWEHQLLDLGKRNKMINYRETKRATLKITEPSLSVSFTISVSSLHNEYFLITKIKTRTDKRQHGAINIVYHGSTHD